ncbi:MAG: hypothetical protein OEV95_14910, partial [Gemmatimonadota bacterium]|nr:hypothetical protein [Gemmatimonadota bacterium]
SVPDLPAAWHWLARPHPLPDISVRSLRGGVTAAWATVAAPAAGDTAGVFELTLPSGATGGDFTLRPSVDWLVAPPSVPLEPGPNRVVLLLSNDARLGPGVHVGVVSGWTADTLAGPAFRLVATLIVPDRVSDSIVDLGHLAPGTEVRHFVPADAERPFEVGVGTLVGGEQALVFVHEPRGAPFRELHALTAGFGADAAVFDVDGRDVIAGDYEVVVVAHPEQPATAALRVARSPVGIHATRTADSILVRLHNYTTDPQTVETAAALIGAERQQGVAGRGSAPLRVPFAIPGWARHLTVDLSLDPDLWPEFTDFGVTVLDAEGRQLIREPLQYAFGRVHLDLDSTRAGAAELLLLPGFAEKGEHDWRGALSIRLYAAMPEGVQHSPAVTIAPGATSSVTLPWQDSPLAAGEAFFPLGIAAITVNQRLWTREVFLSEPVMSSRR